MSVSPAPRCTFPPTFTSRFKEAIVECLDQVEGKHSEAIASLMTLKFQTFNNAQLLAA